MPEARTLRVLNAVSKRVRPDRHDDLEMQREVAESYDKVANGQAATGYPTLLKLLPHADPVLPAIAKALGFEERRRQLIERPIHLPPPSHGKEQTGSSDERRGADTEKDQDVAKSSTIDLLRYLPNDTGNAHRLVALFGTDLRYCHLMCKWLWWDGRPWKIDTTGEAQRLAKRTMIEFLRQAVEAQDKGLKQFAIGSLNERRITHLLILAQSEIYIEPQDLDTHDFLLNVRNGTLDLRTLELHGHRREDYISKLVDVEYDPAAECPRWEAFLKQILDQDLIPYLQTALGYSITGTTIGKAVFVLWGRPNAGKTTLLTIIRELIFEYAVLIQVETLMARRLDASNMQADLADLRGARFVQTSEIEAEQRLSQARLKSITQGMGHIKATRKYENPMTFRETHKLWIDTNQKPIIRDVEDAATFNRLHPIPFLKSIPKEEIDRQLPEKLRTELPGILGWIARGARMYYEQGLEKPQQVEDATADWKRENDNIARFVEECCEFADDFEEAARPLYAMYHHWADRSGERFTASIREFSNRLIQLGYPRRHTESGEVYQGLRLKESVRAGPL